MAVTGGQAAWNALGLGSGGDGSLQKLKIRYEVRSDKKGKILSYDDFDVLFNPNRLVYTRKVKWEPKDVASKGFMQNARQLSFTESQPETLALQLFFDTYEGVETGGVMRNFVMPANPFSQPGAPLSMLVGAPRAVDVRDHTEKVAELARIKAALHRSPRCFLSWGRTKLFAGVLTKLTQKFTMFMPDGTPVRATMDCVFTEFNTIHRVMGRDELQSSDVAKTVVMQSTDSLPAIAAAEYNDPAQWRLIAKANGIANPRTVAPGTVLILPPLPG